jgi:hypothetical protein
VVQTAMLSIDLAPFDLVGGRMGSRKAGQKAGPSPLNQPGLE